jgi:hypothetical protein
MYADFYIVSSAPTALNLPRSEPGMSPNISDTFDAHIPHVSISRGDSFLETF